MNYLMFHRYSFITFTPLGFEDNFFKVNHIIRIYILYLPKGILYLKKFEFSPISSPIRKTRVCLIYSQSDNIKAKEITW